MAPDIETSTSFAAPTPIPIFRTQRSLRHEGDALARIIGIFPDHATLNGVAQGAALIDTGCHVNYLSRAFAERFGLGTYGETTQGREIHDLNGKPIKTLGTVECRFMLYDWKPSSTHLAPAKGPLMTATFEVTAHNLQYDAIIGFPTIKFEELLELGPKLAGGTSRPVQPASDAKQSQANQDAADKRREQNRSKKEAHKAKVQGSSKVAASPSGNEAQEEISPS